MVPFAAGRDDSFESLKALGALIGPGESAILLQADDILLPPSLSATLRADGVQMVATSPMAVIEDHRIEPLTSADADEILALASLTKPGPLP